MTASGHPNLTSAHQSRPLRRSPIHEDIHGRIELLRDRLIRIDGDQTPLHLWEGVRDAVEGVCQEHTGMAEELLGVYEQLGVVFDVTRRLSVDQEETDMVTSLVDSLQRSFARYEVVSVYPRDLCDMDSDSLTFDMRLVQQATEQRRVMVATLREGGRGDGAVEAMAGPIFAGEADVCSILLKRDREGPAFRASDMLLLESLTLFCGDLIRNHRLVRELREMSLAMVRSLVSAVDQKDEYTSGHSLRVGYFATLLGESLGLGDFDLQMLRWSALLHDVGKIGIRDEVLKKPGKLTSEEYTHIKEHPVRSHHVVQEIPQLKQALDGVLHHHERYDGHGYPHGLEGETIPLQARIIQIADVFDALTSTRSYRPAYCWREALDILRQEAGRAVDPQLQPRFEAIIRERLEGRPGAWERMIREANEFMKISHEGNDRDRDE